MVQRSICYGDCCPSQRIFLIWRIKNLLILYFCYLVLGKIFGQDIDLTQRNAMTKTFDIRNARIKVQCHCTPKDSLDKWYWMDRLNTIRHLLSGNTNEHHVLKVEYMQEEPILKNYFKIDYISLSWFHVIILRVKLDFNLVVIKLYMHQHSNQVLLQ